MQLPAAILDINGQWTGVQGRLLQHDRLSIGEKQQSSELSIRCSADEHLWLTRQCPRRRDVAHWNEIGVFRSILSRRDLTLFHVLQKANSPLETHGAFLPLQGLLQSVLWAHHLTSGKHQLKGIGDLMRD